jgi:hypothetical protein
MIERDPRTVTRALSLLLAVACALLACATPVSPNGDRTRLVVISDLGTLLYDGQATFVLRKPERVVTLRPYGEIHIGVEGDDARCRFVWSKDGIDKLHILEGEACPRVEGDRVCFAKTRFASNGHVPALTADGCAYENDLKWSKLQGAREATVGPVAWRTRCVELPARKAGCELTYLALVDVQVQENEAPLDGVSFAYQADAWRACFSERDSGAYRIVLEVEDTCGTRATETLTGDSRDLDD